MIKITKLLYALSVLIYLFTLLYVYAFLPDQVGIYFDDSGNISQSVNKADFFYAALGFFVLTNGLIILYRRLYQRSLDTGKTDFKMMTDAELVYHWLNGLSLVINIIYIFSILFIGMYHNAEHFNISNYVALVYTGPVLLVGWVFWFIYLKISKA